MKVMNRVWELQKRHNLTNIELVELTGVDESTIIAWKYNRNKAFRSETIVAFCRAFNLDEVEQLIYFANGSHEDAELKQLERRREIVDIILSLRERGSTYEEIARHLNESNYVTSRGNQFGVQTVFRIVKRSSNDG